jgi:hypothetical protein
MKTMQLPLDFQDGIYGALGRVLLRFYKHIAPPGLALITDSTLKGFMAHST